MQEEPEVDVITGSDFDQSEAVEVVTRSVQTLITRMRPPPKKVERFERDTQTVERQVRSSQSMREFSQQTARGKNFIPSTKFDREVYAKEYETAEEFTARKLRALITIQKHARAFFARIEANRRRRERDIIQKEAEERAAEAAEKAAAEREYEINRRLHPRTSEDFQILYDELSVWVKEQKLKILEGGLSPYEQKTALTTLLNKETRLLQTIDVMKADASRQNKEARIEKTLRCMAAPKAWPGYDGQPVLVHTPTTVRAAELRDLYHGLKNTLLTVDERLDVLLHVKWTAKEFDCKLTRDIVQLVDREADMLDRGRPERTITGLRARISGLFLDFVMTPDFNPAAVDYQRVPPHLIDRDRTKPLTVAGPRIVAVQTEEEEEVGDEVDEYDRDPELPPQHPHVDANV